MWTIPVSSEPKSSKAQDFEDQYYQVKKERDAMQQALNGLGDENRQLRTKCAQLETFRKKAVSGVVDTDQLLALGKPKAMAELQHDYDDLFKCYSGLQREYRAVSAKHKSSLQTICKQKREIQTLKLR